MQIVHLLRKYLLRFMTCFLTNISLNLQKQIIFFRIILTYLSAQYV